MQAEVISIGDELTTGQRLDTNSQWLSQRLGELGIRVLYHTTVADELAANVRVFREALERADLVVATGGLGPTDDDLTREAISQATGKPLELDDPALAHIRGMFASRRREMPQKNVVQAMFPAGSRIVPNPNGTAPGIDMDVPRGERGDARLFALPGVPAELREMWHATVAGQLHRAGGGKPRVIRHRRVKCFGVGESDLEQMLPDLIRRGRTPAVGITVNNATITLRITAEGDTPCGCDEAMEPTIQTIHQSLGTLVFGREDDELEHAVIRLLGERGATLATAEWGTGGLVAHWLSDVQDANGAYVGGVFSPNKEVLTSVLGVAPELVDKHGPVSKEVVEAMAIGCRENCSANYGLAVGEFPGGETAAGAPGRFFLALATRDGVAVKSPHYAGHPAILKARSAKQALDFLRLSLLEAAR